MIRAHQGKLPEVQDCPYHRTTGKDGVIHACTGVRISDHDPGTFCIWTVCGRHDVPSGKSYLTDDAEITCADCVAKGAG